jgi:hypothetical protein
MMSGSKSGIGHVFLALALSLLIGVPAYAQGSIFSTLSGTVVDAEGLPIPGASVKIKNNGTGQEIDLVSGGDGGFTAPNISSGNYSVSVELAGFRTTTLSSVSVAAGIPTGRRRVGHGRPVAVACDLDEPDRRADHEPAAHQPQRP